MKLSKRIAAAVLAALMAVSMMTACGGNSSSNKPSSSSKPSSGKPASSASTSGSSSNSNSGSTIDPDSLPDLDKGSGIPIDWQKTYAKQYLDRMENVKTYSMNLEMTEGNEYMKAFYAVSGDNTYLEYLAIVPNDTDVPLVGTATLRTGDYETWLIKNKKVAVMSKVSTTSVESEPATMSVDIPEVETAIKAERGTKTINGKKYYAEKITAIYNDNGVKQVETITYCLNQKKEVEYFIEEGTGMSTSVIYHITNFTTNVNQDTFKIPGDYEIYFVLTSSSGETIITTEDGQLVDYTEFVKKIGME